LMGDTTPAFFTATITTAFFWFVGVDLLLVKLVLPFLLRALLLLPLLEENAMDGPSDEVESNIFFMRFAKDVVKRRCGCG